jgi:U4/U6.U5 tri-snRNP-associated protein 2
VAEQTVEVPSAAEIQAMSVGELKRFLARYNISAGNVVEKQELVELAQDFVVNKLPDLLSTKYDLIANICHDSPPGESGQATSNAHVAGSYRVHVINKVHTFRSV